MAKATSSVGVKEYNEQEYLAYQEIARVEGDVVVEKPVDDSLYEVTSSSFSEEN